MHNVSLDWEVTLYQLGLYDVAVCFPFSWGLGMKALPFR